MTRVFAALLIGSSLCSCNTMSKILNPFQETPPPEALLGEKNDKALSEESNKAESARAALESMASYQKTNLPQPYNPVMQPSVVRLMWVPDHLNRFGDMIPSHYYYLKVKSDQWNLQDAFELEGQMKKSGGADSSLPYAVQKDIEQ